MRPEPAFFETACPLSWAQLENPLSDNRFYQVQLTKSRQGQPIGRLYLAIVSKSTEPDMTRIPALFDAQYQREGILFGPLSFNGLSPFGGLQQVWYALADQQNPADQLPHQREVVVGQAGTNWFYAERFSLTRAESPESWAISKRAFELVLDRLVVHP